MIYNAFKCLVQSNAVSLEEITQQSHRGIVVYTRRSSHLLSNRGDLDTTCHNISVEDVTTRLIQLEHNPSESISVIIGSHTAHWCLASKRSRLHWVTTKLTPNWLCGRRVNSKFGNNPSGTNHPTDADSVRDRHLLGKFSFIYFVYCSCCENRSHSYSWRYFDSNVLFQSLFPPYLYLHYDTSHRGSLPFGACVAASNRSISIAI